MGSSQKCVTVCRAWQLLATRHVPGRMTDRLNLWRHSQIKLLRNLCCPTEIRLNDNKFFVALGPYLTENSCTNHGNIP